MGISGLRINKIKSDWGTGRLIFILLCFLSVSFKTQALECYMNVPGGTTEEVVDIGTLKVPATLPVGSRLWTSEERTRTVVCKAYENVPAEYVYFYPTPNQPVFAPGIKMGIIYNGADLGINNNKKRTDIYANKDNWTTATIRFQIYLEKSGTINPVTTDRVQALQLDGEYGINNQPGKNYSFFLTGMTKIEVIQCAVSINLDNPSGVNFGTLPVWAAGKGEIVRKDFNLSISKNSCSEDFQLDADFTVVNGSLLDATGLNMDNGSVMRIRDNSNPKWIEYNQFQPFADMTGRDSVSKNYSAVLEATADGQEGDFSKSLILRINYL